MSPDKNTQVVIVGGGFAGVSCAHKLAGTSGLHITLIDKNNYHQFQPLLYQVATAELGPSDVAFMLRKTLKEHPNVEVKMEEVASVDAKTLTVTTAKGSTYCGDFLVLAAGSQPNFFGTPGADKNTFPLYALEQAERLRSRILAVFEAADRDPALIDKGALNFVIVGGGPTGTEMAGALAEMVAGALTSEFKDLAMQRVQIFLVDHGPGLLAAFSEKAQAYACKTLRERGVQFRFGVRVEKVGPDHVSLSDGSKILTHTVIWAGGLKASPLSSRLGIVVGDGDRIDVLPELSVQGFPRIYALGDFANIVGEDGKALPQLASVAQQCGKWCAKNILADLAGRPSEPFQYFDKGIMAMIGRNAAVAEVGEHRYEIDGAIGFAAWLGVHAALLSTARAKTEAFMEWAWDYCGRTRGLQVLDRSDAARINWSDNVSETMSRGFADRGSG